MRKVVTSECEFRRTDVVIFSWKNLYKICFSTKGFKILNAIEILQIWKLVMFYSGEKKFGSYQKLIWTSQPWDAHIKILLWKTSVWTYCMYWANIFINIRRLKTFHTKSVIFFFQTTIQKITYTCLYYGYLLYKRLGTQLNSLPYYLGLESIQNGRGVRLSSFICDISKKSRFSISDPTSLSIHDRKR